MGLLLFALYGPLRRRAFELFYRLHWVGFLVVIGAALAHEAGAVSFGIILWAVDVALRYGYQASCRYPREARIEALEAGVVRVVIPAKAALAGSAVAGGGRGGGAQPHKATLRFRAGQYVFLCVPELGLFEWHPFSISSCPAEASRKGGEVVLHVRALGDWTTRLHKLAQATPGGTTLPVLLEGPCGEPKIDVEGGDYAHFLLISGGIGITPLQSVANQLLDEKRRGRKVDLIWFVWAVREIQLVGAVTGLFTTSDRLPASFVPDGLSELGHSAEVARLWKESSAKQMNDSEAGGAAATITCSPGEVEGLHTEFYLTRSKANEALLAKKQQQRQGFLRLGRPDVDRIVATMARHVALGAGASVASGALGDGEKGEKKSTMEKKSPRRVAVLTCGPPGLVAAVAAAVEKHSSGAVRFDIHIETFEF
mmetsp:Transcript_65269/g.147206  ORF Transcript_65269/g.147206 Transcript_65269/m.147206 type:complete len:425 (-) Transcript_65269:99-1373(-)